MKPSTKYSPEVRGRAVRLVLDHQGGHDSQWSAILSASSKIGCTSETLRRWVRQAELDGGAHERGARVVARGKGDARPCPTRAIARALYPERTDCIVYTEKGQVRCRCPSTGEGRDLAFWGFESGRNALKYRCPAAVHGFMRNGRTACERIGGRPNGNTGAWCASCSTGTTGASSPPPPTVAPHGSAATFGARPWNGSTPVWIVASSSSRTSSGACPGCARAWAWRSR